MVKRVATQAALRLAETKRFALLNENWTPTPSNNSAIQWYYRPVFAPLDQGFAGYQFVGSEIQRPLLSMKGRITIPWDQIRQDVITNYSSVAVTVALIATNDAYTNEVPAQYSLLSPAQNWFYQPNVYNPTFNGSNVKVLKKRTYIMSPDQMGQISVQGRTVKPFKMKYRWRKKISFEDAPTIPDGDGPSITRSLRGWNYYILVGWQLQANLNLLTNFGWPQVALDSFLYYKDP